jgi:hypothetical protein
MPVRLLKRGVQGRLYPSSPRTADGERNLQYEAVQSSIHWIRGCDLPQRSLEQPAGIHQWGNRARNQQRAAPSGWTPSTAPVVGISSPLRFWPGISTTQPGASARLCKRAARAGSAVSTALRCAPLAATASLAHPPTLQQVCPRTCIEAGTSSSSGARSRCLHRTSFPCFQNATAYTPYRTVRHHMRSDM